MERQVCTDMENLVSFNTKYFMPFFCAVLFLVMLSGCAGADEESGTTVLRISNWEEYIDEGSWDEDETIDLDDGTEITGINNMIDDFENWYEKTYGKKVSVEYSTFGTNEELYNQMSLGDKFDLVCPSEYMIMKLIQEGRLQPFSEEFYGNSEENNFYSAGVSPYIKNIFDNLDIGGESLTQYAAGYMWGVMGFVYNPDEVPDEDTRNWKMMLDKKYRKRITMKDSVRDSYIVALAILNEEKLLSPEFISSEDYNSRLSEIMNDTSKETVELAEEILTNMRENSYSLETDSGKADLVSGKVVANLQWSGDGAYTLEQAEEDGLYLSYAVPDEGSNLWFDGWCMMKNGVGGNADKQHAAEAFVNFVSRPDNVIRNMYYVGYTSVIAGGESDLIYQYADWCYGSEDSDVETVKYPLGYFFAGENKKDEVNYVINVPIGEENRQVYARYPKLETIKRCAVMKNFNDEENRRISQMWTDIRCFDLKSLF